MHRWFSFTRFTAEFSTEPKAKEATAPIASKYKNPLVKLITPGPPRLVVSLKKLNDLFASTRSLVNI
jgi:hypothetical protein